MSAEVTFSSARKSSVVPYRVEWENFTVPTMWATAGRGDTVAGMIAFAEASAFGPRVSINHMTSPGLALPR